GLFTAKAADGLVPMPLSMEVVMLLAQWVISKAHHNLIVFFFLFSKPLLLIYPCSSSFHYRRGLWIWKSI
ncbi:hypothetical protein PJI17_31600, partial [Mycobacterium kansasii]